MNTIITSYLEDSLLVEETGVSGENH